MNRAKKVSRAWTQARQVALYWRHYNRLVKRGIPREEAERVAAARAEGRMS